MANIMDYLYWRGDLEFSLSPFNDIDNLILSEICYIDFNKRMNKYLSVETKRFQDVANELFLKQKKEDMVLGLIVPQSIVTLCDIAKDTNRFKNIFVSNYINQVNVKKSYQFSAMCFHISEDEIYIALRGTDDTISGWQENLDMLCVFPVPAQVKAAEYVNHIANLYPQAKLIIGGHSKGGNLAIYSAIYCEDDIKDRIIKIYSNDGPGFTNGKVDINRFSLIKDKIIRIIPESSVIGMLLEVYSGTTKIVKSNVKGLRQHDGFSWEVDVNHFSEVQDITTNAKKLDEAITKMIEKLSEDERKELARNIYDFVIELNKETLIEASKDSLRLIKYINKISKKSKRIFFELVYNLIKYKQL